MHFAALERIIYHLVRAHEQAVLPSFVNVHVPHLDRSHIDHLGASIVALEDKFAFRSELPKVAGLGPSEKKCFVFHILHGKRL